MHPLSARVSARAANIGVILNDSLLTSLLAYYDVLFRWNAKINLTSLADPDEAIDRLLLEPAAAAQHLPRNSTLMDLGSGGGSPAIPLALALGSPRLVMVESRGRKAAFLREAARTVGLQASVEAERFEDVSIKDEYHHEFTVVSMRAVRMDAESLSIAAGFAASEGWVALFISCGASPELPLGVSTVRRVPLLPASELLLLHGDVPRETSPL
jgi:16S rRNA (guanine527-N7)-methyltransferase